MGWTLPRTGMWHVAGRGICHLWLPCLILFWSMHFCMVHSIGPINVCTNFEINRDKIDEFRKHAKNRMFYLTWHDAKKPVRQDTYDRYFDQEHFATNQRLCLKQCLLCLSCLLVTLTWTFDTRKTIVSKIPFSRNFTSSQRFQWCNEGYVTLEELYDVYYMDQLMIHYDSKWLFFPNLHWMHKQI